MDNTLLITKLAVVAARYRNDAFAVLDVLTENEDEFSTESALAMATSATLKLKMALVIENTQDQLDKDDHRVVRAELLASETTEGIEVARMITQADRGDEPTM